MGIVLGLSGPARAGKDTVADFLISNCGWTGKLSFARNLKDMCKEVFTLSEYEVGTQEGKQSIFPEPKLLEACHLGRISNWMFTTHPHAKISPDCWYKVKSLIGSKLRTPREVLQLVGTEVCRTLIPSYHVDVVINGAKTAGNWVVTDVRFPNEGNIIIDGLRGYVLNIDRPVDNTGAVNMLHPSETAMKDWGRFIDTVDNSKEGLEFLFKEVKSFFERNNLKCHVAQ